MFLVGVGGAVPHYTDFERHVRLGDVVMSAPPLDGQRYNFFKVAIRHINYINN